MYQLFTFHSSFFVLLCNLFFSFGSGSLFSYFLFLRCFFLFGWNFFLYCFRLSLWFSFLLSLFLNWFFFRSFFNCWFSFLLRLFNFFTSKKFLKGSAF